MDSHSEILAAEIARDVEAEDEITAALDRGDLVICQGCGGAFDVDRMCGDLCDGCEDERREDSIQTRAEWRRDERRGL